jgi:hypothetical protein
MTDIQELRCIIGDLSGQRYTDEELQVFLDCSDSVNQAAALVFQDMKIRAMSEPSSFRSGDQALVFAQGNIIEALDGMIKEQEGIHESRTHSKANIVKTDYTESLYNGISYQSLC